MAKFLSAVVKVLKKLLTFASSDVGEDCLELVEKSAENSAIINNSKYQSVVKGVIETVKGAVRYSLKTDEEKKKIITTLVIEKFSGTKLAVSSEAISVLVELLFDRVKAKTVA